MIELEVRHIRIPYRFRYAHARHVHVGLDAVICVARDEEGRVGLGEAVPRSYVTGESCDSIMAAIPPLAARIRADGEWAMMAGPVRETAGSAKKSAGADRELAGSAERSAGADREMADLRRHRVGLAREWDGPFPSGALCALDTALLDLRGRRLGRPMAEQLGGRLPQTLEYTASIGVGGRAWTTAQLAAYRAIGIRRFKVKVGDKNDIRRVRWVRRLLGREASIFVDANAVWDRETAIRRMEALAPLGIWAVEEPLKPRAHEGRIHGQEDRLSILDEKHFESYRWLRERSTLPLIADESLICWKTAERIVAHSAFDIFAIRLSKCGGPLLTAEMADLALGNGLRFSQGAMVGETAVLATSGAHFAAAHPRRLYLQGYSHKLQHREWFVRGEPPMGRGTLRVTGEGAGLGLEVHPARLDAVTVRTQQVGT